MVLRPTASSSRCPCSPARVHRSQVTLRSAPAVVVWIVMPWLVAFGIGARFFLLRPLWHALILSWAAAIVIIFGWLATRICWRRMGASWRMGIDPAEKTLLIAAGPYVASDIRFTPCLN